MTRENVVFFSFIVYSIAILGSMATMNIGAALAIVAVVVSSPSLKVLWGEIWSLFLNRTSRIFLILTLVLVAVCLASLVLANWDPLGFGGRFVQVEFPGDMAKAWYFVLPFFLAIGWGRMTKVKRATVIRTWLITFGVVSAIGSLQVITGWPTYQPNPLLPGYFHSSLFMGHHLSVATAWVFPFFVACNVIASPFLRKTLRLSKGFLLVSIVLGLVVLFFTFSRMLWVALPVGLSLFIFLNLPKKAIIISVLTLSLGGAILASTDMVQRRLHHPLGVGPRVELWQANLEFFKRRPILGVGWRKNEPLSGIYLHYKYPEKKSVFAGHAHTNYLEVLAGLGVIGFAIWLFWNVVILQALFLLRNKVVNREAEGGLKPVLFPTAMIAAWITLHLNGITQVNFWDSKVMHEMMWSIGLILFWMKMMSKPKKAHT